MATYPKCKNCDRILYDQFEIERGLCIECYEALGKEPFEFKEKSNEE